MDTTTKVKLAPGRYALKCDIDNPKPDRRHTYDWRKQDRWPAGTVFIIELNSWTSNDFSFFQLHSGRRTWENVSESDPLFHLIAQHLEPRKLPPTELEAAQARIAVLEEALAQIENSDERIPPFAVRAIARAALAKEQA